MSLKNLIALFIAFSVLLVPAASNGAMVAHDRQMADCHSSKQVDCHKHAAKTSHCCCVELAGIASPAILVHPSRGDDESIPFSPSLSLTSRMEGLYRPPRQIS